MEVVPTTNEVTGLVTVMTWEIRSLRRVFHQMVPELIPVFKHFRTISKQPLGITWFSYTQLEQVRLMFISQPLRNLSIH